MSNNKSKDKEKKLEESEKNSTKNIIKQKFKAKLEIEKRKQEYLDSIKKIQESKKEAIAKGKELKESIRQEAIKQKEELRKATLQYKKNIKNQRKLVSNQYRVIREEQSKNREKFKLEMQKIQNISLSKRLQFKKEILEAQKDRKKFILNNREEIQKIKQNIELEIRENKEKYNKKRLELAREQVSHIEKLTRQKKELESLKKQQSLSNVEFYKKLAIAKQKRVDAQKARKQEIKALIQKEKNNLQLDINQIKKEKISYEMLLKQKEQNQKIQIEKLKLEKEKLSQIEKAQEIMRNEALASKESSLLDSQQNIYKIESFIQTNGDSSSTIVDQKHFPSPIDLNNETLKGFVINEVGAKALKVFQKLNRKRSLIPLEKAKITNEEKQLIEKVRELRLENSLVPISQYAKLAAFIENKKLTNERIQGIIVSIVYNLTRGKVFSFLGGYFSIVKVRGYRKIVYRKTAQKISRFSIINLPESNATKKFEEIIASKLAFQPFIKITENITLANIDNQIKVITDIPFMR